MFNIALIGTPNSGKTSIFNLLTGKFQKVANYEGITIDIGNSPLLSNINNNSNSSRNKKPNVLPINLIDLPGIRSLVPRSTDEGITIETLLVGDLNQNKLDAIVVVLDLFLLESTLPLLIQLVKMFGTKKVSCIVNKVDSEEFINKESQEKMIQMTGVPIIFASALKDRRVRIDDWIRKSFSSQMQVDNNSSNNDLCYEGLKPLNKLLQTQNSISYIPKFSRNSPDIDKKYSNINIVNNYEIMQNVIFYQNESRKIFDQCNNRSDIQDKKIKQTDMIDKLIMHPVFGIFIFFAIFYVMFLAVYSWPLPVMDLCTEFFSLLSDYIKASMPAGIVQSFLTNGLIAGVGGVIIFLPQIMTLFFLLSLIEQSGYIARAAFLLDKVFSVFGLNGKSFLPYLSGFACAVPAILVTRTISDKRERMATLLTIPLITCSARLPVYLLIVGTFIPDHTYFKIFNTRAMTFFLLYFLGAFSALVVAKIFRLSFFVGENNNFFLNLPNYQMPSLKIAIKSMLQKGRMFLKKAGGIILIISIFIWAASTFPRLDKKLIQSKSIVEQHKLSLEYSMIGRSGKIIEPLLTPLGLDWRVGIGLLSSFAARELFVSTMGTIFSIEDSSSHGLAESLKHQVNAKTGKPLFTVASSLGLLMFFVFSLQCVSTLSIIFKETNSHKIVYGIFFLYLFLGYFFAFFTNKFVGIVFQT